MSVYRGNLLSVNLSSGEIRKETIDPQLWKNWLGGRGLGTKWLIDSNERGLDALAESSPIFFITAPLIGTLAPGTCKTTAVFRSPFSGAVFASLCGGHLGAMLRFAGWDAVKIFGKSDKPVTLAIIDDKVELRDASAIWGLETGETGERLREEFSPLEIQWALIGPAGENGVKFASIHSGRGREFGRGGGGCVFGSKKLKAIVVSGTGAVPVADRSGAEKLARAAYERITKDAKAQVRKRWGTIELVSTINDLGFWPTRNYKFGHLESGDRIDANAYENKVLVGHRSCNSCPVGCGKVGRFKAPDGGEFEIEGPEFESLTLLGPNLGFDDFHIIAEATRLCDELGVDTIQMGGVLGSLFEAAQNGLLPKNIAGDFDIGFEKAQSAFDLIRRCAYLEGELGKLLSLGPEGFAEEIGAPELAMTVKGLNLPAYDPRGLKGIGLTYATAAQGASHMRGPTMGPEIGGGKRLEEKNKIDMVIDCQVSMAIADSVGLCSTIRGGMHPAHIAEFLEAVTGDKWTAERLLEIGKNIITLERCFNLREGFSRKDDTLPKRFLEEPMPSGNSKNSTFDLEAMLDEYYRKMGWDDDGVPPDCD